jgi:hypothetical protein
MKAPQAKKINQFLINRIPPYNFFVPLDEIKSIVETVGNTTVLDDDGEPLTGVVMCGDDGRAKFNLKDSNYCLTINWHKMQSGRYEIVSYVS